MRSPDVKELALRIAAQFRSLDPKQPGQWPLLPKLAAWFGAAILAFFGVWYALISDFQWQLSAAIDKEEKLKQEYRDKLGKALALEDLRKQKLQVLEFVNQLERQLPSKSEMDALLSDINQSGVGRGLQFELFKPGQGKVNDFYAELPVTLRITGTFHDMGAFASDVANLSRIVTLHDINLVAAGGKDAKSDGKRLTLVMDATARTYRYLDPEEIAAQKKVRDEQAKAGKK